jgi:hypothetical protein
VKGKEKEGKIVIEKSTENEQGIEIVTGIGIIKILSGKDNEIINIFSSIDSHRYMVVITVHLHPQDRLWYHIIISRPLIITIGRHHITITSFIITIHRPPYHQEVSGVLQSFIVQGRVGTTIPVVLLHSYIQVRVHRIPQKSSCFLRVTSLLLNRSYTLESENENRGPGKVQMNNIIIHQLRLRNIANVNVNVSIS